jgi:hypothetical protein
MTEAVSKKGTKRIPFAKVIVMPSLEDLVDSVHVQPHEMRLSNYARELNDNEFRSDVTILFHASLYDLLSDEIYSLAQERTEKFGVDIVNDLKSLGAGSFEFRTRGLELRIRRFILDLFIVKPNSSESNFRDIENLSASIRALIKRWKENYRTSDTKSCSTAQRKLKRQFYGRIHLVEDLLRLRFVKTRHAEFRRFIEDDVLKYDRTISLLRGGNVPRPHEATDIESFLKSYRRSKKSKSLRG